MNWLEVFLALVAVALSHAANVTVTSNTVLDANAIYFVSYDGLVNANSFEISAVVTFNGYQYATWYTSTKYAIIARRQLPSGSWSTLQLNHQISATDSHNVVVLGISPQDGKIHIGMDCHSTPLYYIQSEAGLATSPSRSWVASRFGAASTTLGNVNLGSQITYPQFVVVPSTQRLQFSYRTGISGNGQASLAEYNNGAWTNLGAWSSATGTYTSPNSVKSTAHNLYIHGFTYKGTRLHSAGTWREQNSAVMCNSGGLSNHDTVYVSSSDNGRTWQNDANATVATTGTSTLVAVGSAGIIVDAIDSNHGMINQESQAVDSAGFPHVVISYVPGRFTQCVTSYAADRAANGRAFHLWRNATVGGWTKVEIPWALGSTGRSQVVVDGRDNVWVVLPFVRVVVATKAGGYTDWTMVYDGTATGLRAFGEVVVDKTRVEAGENVLSVLYQVASSGTTPSALHLIDFTLNA